ncbi:cell envelope integrity protein TolA [Pseudomonas songnenensis]|uniref:Cell envelope integrity protein TolA n=1 Tax=Pseudomonas songnenensis TaxID=1176259 RepID=A0ABX9UX55_9PSED|nr:cell envelope integrity protein TolA [Pseudomonas songnenensis]MCQ4300909.1 cell envelope integrity protein TolA [Pseudomonas songnenensis]RMH97991.1 cell envelope integrity protein TolA [Pseudomonas songnenensis]
MQQRDSSPSQSYFWPTVLAVGLHVIIFGMLFVSFSMTPELPPSKPIVQATLYQLKSQSQATTQTNQKIAGEAKRTAAKQFESEQMEQRKVEQEKQAAAARAAEQKKAEEARKADAAKAAAEKAAAAKKAEEAKKVEQQKQAEIAKKKAAEELAKQKAAEEAKKKAAEEAKRKAAEEAKKKAAAEAAKKKAAEDAKKKAAADAARKAAEDKKAQALAELLSDTTERQQALADTHGDQVAGNFDDLIRLRAAEGWTRPPSARNNMTVQLQVNMLPDGTITNVSVSRSSGDVPFDNSAVAAVKNIGRLTEMQGLSPQDFQPYRSFKMTFTPEDLAL